MSTRIGVMLPRTLPIADFVPFARRAEELGFDELWVVEDCFFRGGIAQAATVLAMTERIRVGIGIMPAAPRNVAFSAMELATLAELHPGRLIAGLGHGVTDWMKQIGVWPQSPLTLIEEQLGALRRLLAGEELNLDGRYVHLDAVRLENRVDPVPPVFAGVRGPKSLAAAGRAADGTLLAEPVTPEYVRVAREQIGDAPGHELVAYEFAVVDDDADAARRAVRPSLATVGDPSTAAHTAMMPYRDDIVALRQQCSSDEEFAERMPDAWVDDLALVGSAERVRGRIAELDAAGADSVVLIPVGDDRLGELDQFAAVLG